MKNILGLFQSGLWPPSTPQWAMFFVALFLLIGLLSLWRRGRVLLLATLLTVVLGLVVVLIRTDTAAAIACLTWITAASRVLGGFALRLARLENEQPLARSERLALSLLLGFGLLSLIAGAMAWAGMLNRWPVVVLLAALVLPAVTSAGRLRRALGRLPGWAGSQWTSAELRWPAVGIACLVTCVGFPLLWALAPSVHWDALASHLPVASAYASQAGFSAVSELWYSYLSGQSHLLYALALALVGQPLPALTHFAFGLITTLLVFSLARRLAGPAAGWLAAVAFASMPMVGWEAGTAYMDLFVTGYVFGSLHAVLRWREARSPGWLLLAGVLGGMAIGTKLSAAIFLLAPAVYVLIASLRLGSMRKTALALAAYAPPLALLPMPWLVRNWLWTGNPVYPMLGGVFRNPETDSFAVNWGTFGVGKGPLYLLRLPYDLVVHGKSFDEAGVFAFGILFIAAFASLFLGGKQVRWAVRGLILSFVVAGMTLWFVVGQVSRYLLPLMPLMTVLAVLPLPSLFKSAACRLRWTLGVLGVLGVLYVSYTRGVATLWNYNLPEGYPYRYALGLETKEQLLERALAVYSAFQHINAHKAASSRIFSPTSQIRFYMDVRLDDPIYNLHTRDLMQLPAGNALVRELTTRGYDCIVLDRARITAGLVGIPYLDRTFLKGFTDLEYSVRNVEVYRIRSKEEGRRPAASELLTNGSFDELAEAKVPLGWWNFGSPKLIDRAAAAHSPPAFVEVSQEGSWLQRVSAKPGGLYTVSLWARADASGQSVWLQVLWLDSAIKILDTGIRELLVTSKWQQFHASFTAPKSNTAFVQVYARAAPGSVVFVDDVSFVREW